MPTYSNSRLSCFEQCPLKFKFSYIDKIETEMEETVEAFLGSRVHEALEKLYKDLKFQKLNTLKDILEFYNKEWSKNWNGNIVIVRKDYDQENYKKMGEKFITDYYNRYKPFDDTKTIGLETQNFADLGNGYKIHIRIDRLAVKDDIYEIHDYKTSNSLPTQDKLDSDRQLAVYAYGIKKMYPDAKKIKLVWHFLAFDKEMSSVRTEEQLEEMKKEILGLIKEIESCSDFKAKESALCDWCEFQASCPNFKHKYSIEEKPDNGFLKDDGVKLVNEYASTKKSIDDMETKLDKIREALLAFAKKEKVEVVYGSDVKASVKTYPKLSFPKKNDPHQKAFFETVKKIGLWDKLATVDVYSLAKMINNGMIHDDLKKLLDRFITKGEITRVSLRGE